MSDYYAIYVRLREKTNRDGEKSEWEGRGKWRQGEILCMCDIKVPGVNGIPVDVITKWYKLNKVENIGCLHLLILSIYIDELHWNIHTIKIVSIAKIKLILIRLVDTKIQCS